MEVLDEDAAEAVAGVGGVAGGVAEGNQRIKRLVVLSLIPISVQ